MFEVNLREVRSLLEACSKSTWDIFEVYLRHVRSNAESFSQTVGERHTSYGTDMSCMFTNVVNFNQAIGEWDTSKVRDICKFSLAPRASIRPLANGTLQMSGT